jgi:hypothetical protein
MIKTMKTLMIVAAALMLSVCARATEPNQIPAGAQAILDADTYHWTTWIGEKSSTIRGYNKWCFYDHGFVDKGPPLYVEVPEGESPADFKRDVDMVRTAVVTWEILRQHGEGDLNWFFPELLV